MQNKSLYQFFLFFFFNISHNELHSFEAKKNYDYVKMKEYD